MNPLTRLILLPLLSGLLMALTTTTANAEFDPERLSQSTVRVVVKDKRAVVATASGFLWQSPNQVVTSLHVMSQSPGAKIIIEFGKIKRRATVKAVLPKADLVLLDVKKPVEGFIPLTHYNGKKPKYKSEVSALGFNRGALGLSTRELRKGYVKPERLQVLLPPDILARLKDSDILDVKLPIYYLDGSLLPGYSGSPVVNAKGELIGIGDGGLESGAASVSWVIPAKNLKRLMASTITELPASLRSLGTSFSGEVLISSYQPQRLSPLETLYSHNLSPSLNPVIKLLMSHSDPVQPQPLLWLHQLLQDPPILLTRLAKATVQFSPMVALAQQLSGSDLNREDTMGEIAKFVSVPYRQFEFVKVKTRNYQQMITSSGSPTQMNKVFRLYQTFFQGYKVDYRQFEFDVYEDPRYGLNITIPSGTELIVDDNGYLVVKGPMFCRTCPYEIQYHARKLQPQEISLVQTDSDSFLNQVADRHWVDLNEEGDYGEYTDFRQIESYGANRYVLRAAYNNFEQPFKSDFELNYFTAATNRSAWFQAQGILNRFDNRFFELIEQHRGTDCRYVANDPQLQPLCDDISTMLKVMISVHLTSFSNKFYAHTQTPIGISSL